MLKLFGRKRKAIPRKRIRCYICGLEKEMSWDEFAKHIKEHIKNGEVSDIQPSIIGELVGSSEKK